MGLRGSCSMLWAIARSRLDGRLLRLLIGVSVAVGLWHGYQGFREGATKPRWWSEDTHPLTSGAVFPLRLYETLRLQPSVCDELGSAAGTFDEVYMRGFRPIPEWERIKPFDVKVDKGDGRVVITDDMMAHYYKWVDAGSRLSLSGGGSELRLIGPTLRFIEEVVDQYGVKFVLDVPSADANWQFSSFHLDLLPMYVGLDVAQFPVELNQRRFAHHRNKLFARWDVSACALPRLVGTGSNVSMPFVLIVSRDMIHHMPLQLGLRAVRNFARSGARFLLTTTNENFDNVDDAKPDGYYANNLAKAPFNFPRPLKCKRSHPQKFHENDVLCLYDLKDVLSISQSYPV